MGRFFQIAKVMDILFHFDNLEGGVMSSSLEALACTFAKEGLGSLQRSKEA